MVKVILYICMHAIIFYAWHVRTVGFAEGQGTVVECKTVYGVEVGDTCSLIIQKINQSFDAFLAINPNINCDTIFIGQWVCINGNVN